MDKEEFKVKLEQINYLVDKSDYKGALEIVETVDWRRVKNVRTLCVVGEIYAANKRYEESKDTFLLAYHRAPIGKNILSRLIEVSLKAGNVDESMEFYEEFIKVAPNDNTKYVLKYQIFKENHAPLDELIKILEDYKSREFTEKWSYELAKLYYQNGDREKCISICDEMDIWFNDGKYVMKAMDLKMKLGAMTDLEKQKYEQKFASQLKNTEQSEELNENEEDSEDNDSEEVNSDVSENEDSDNEVDKDAIGSISTREEDVNYSESLQERISKGIRDIFNSKKRNIEEDEEEQEDADSESEYTEEDIEEVAELEKEEVISESIEEQKDTDSESKEDEEKDMPVLEDEDSKEEEADDETEEADIPDLEDEDSEEEEEKSDDETEESDEEDVPDLEDEEIEEDEDFEEEIEEKIKKKPRFSFKLPEFKIPKSFRKSRFEEDLKVPEIPKIANIGLVDPVSEEDDNKEFNLEDTILAAASAQGIDVEEEIEDIGENIEDELDELEKVFEDDDNSEEEAEIEDEDESEEEAEIEDEDESEEEAEIEDETEFEDESESEEDDEIEDEDEFEEEAEIEDETEFEDEVEIEDEPEEDLGNVFDDIFSDEIQENDEEEVFEEVDDSEELEDTENDFLKNLDEEFDSAFSLEDEDEDESFDDNLSDKDDFIVNEDLSIEDPSNFVVRGDKLDEEELKLFTYHATVPGMEKQIVDTLKDMQSASADKTSKTGNIIVMGERECGKTRLISGLIPAICRELNIEAVKVAYVFAEQINGKNIVSIVDKLSSGFLVIEDANRLTKETVKQLDKAMEFRTDGLTIIMEDEKNSMRKLLARYPKFAMKFTSVINIPVFTNDELVNFAKVYALERGYNIDQNGMNALYNKIGAQQNPDEPMTIGVVKEIMDDAIAKSEGGIRKLKRNLSKKRTDKDGLKLLYEEDFV